MDEINDEQNPNEPGDPGIDEPNDDVAGDETLADDTDTDEAVSEYTIEEEAVADDTIADETVADDMTTDEAGADTPPPPASMVVDPQADRLTRDPFATFGGVLSGIAHRYGWDVSLTRLAFVVLLIVSGGTAIVAYLLAWIIIPRASHWPPARANRTGARLSPRDLGIGLIGLGALVVLGIGSGKAAAVLVPLAMVGGGIWLLLQNPREEQVVAPLVPAAGGVVPGAEPTVASYVSQPTMPPSPQIAVQAVPKRSRLRRFAIVGFFGTLGLILLTLVAGVVLAIAIVVDGDIDINTDQEYIYRPATFEAIDTNITHDAGEVELDLRAIDFDSIPEAELPIDIDVDLDLGKITVLVPEDVRVSVDADADLGDVTVFGSNDDGINPSRSFDEADPQLVLDVNLNAGEIAVTRDSVATVTITEAN